MKPRNFIPRKCLTNDPYNVEALCAGAYVGRVDPRKLKREKVQNPTSAKIATLENFQLYGIMHCHSTLYNYIVNSVLLLLVPVFM